MEERGKKIGVEETEGERHSKKRCKERKRHCEEVMQIDRRKT